MTVVERSVVVRAPLEAVWDFHADPVGLTRIMPPPASFEIVGVDRPVRAGSRVRLRVSLGPLRLRWNLRVVEHMPMARFVDEQIEGEGPFRRWRHAHVFERTDGGTRITDRIEYEPPFGVLGRVVDAVAGRALMAAQFSARYRATKRLLESG